LDLFIEDVNQTLNDERLSMTQQKSKLHDCLHSRNKSVKDIAACCAAILNDKRIKGPSDLIISQLLEAKYTFVTGGVEELLDLIETQTSRKQVVEFESKLIFTILNGYFGDGLAKAYREIWRDTIVWEIDQLAKHISLLSPKDPVDLKVSAELDAKLSKYLPRKGGFFK